MKKSITVAICSYKRPVSLQRCIESVLNQNTDALYEVIVIDNDHERSAQGITEMFKLNVKYFCQPLKGLSHARNMAVEKANGDFILFIDDDEYADSSWVDNMINCQKNYQADVVLGKVVYVIPDKFPSYIKKSFYFTRKRRVCGEKASVNEGYTGNTLVRKKLFKLRTPPFSVEFNHTGGEDSDFFNFLLSKGTNIVFSNKAVIYETQDDQRLEVSWFYKRGYRTGFNYASHLFKSNFTFIAFIKLLYSVFGGLFLCLIFALKTLFMPNKYFIKMISMIANQIGKLGYLSGYQINDYA